MASVKELVSQICKDPLLLHGIETKCSKILKEVKIPAGWTETYKLENCNPSYKFRVKLMKDFVDVKKSESYTIINNNQQEFTEDLTGFLFEKESHCSDNDLHLPNESSYPDLFEKNWKIEVVVVRKSASRACVLVKSARPRGSPKQEEMILSYNAQQFPGLGIGLKVGDILCVAYNKRKGQQVLEPEVVRHCFLEESEIDCLLSKLLEMKTAVSAMLIEIKQRCFAAWTYILKQLKQEDCSQHVIESILRICDCICSISSKTLDKVMEEFSHSMFLSNILPEFIGKIVPQPGDNSSEICRLLQNFLLHVLKADPSCGQRVLALAKCLTTKMLEGALDLDCAKKTGTLGFEFLFNLSSVVALKVPGAFNDLDSLGWRQLPLIPTEQEIHAQNIKIKKDDLPVKCEQYKSEDDYLDTNFRLMREECFYKLKKGISDFIKGCNPDPRDMMIYRISLRGISTQWKYSPVGLSVCLAFKEEFGKQQLLQEIDWESTNWLLYGNLLCISLDGQFTDPIWVLVERKPSTKDKIVWVTFCTDRNLVNDAEVITKLQGLRDEGIEAYMAESSTFYRAFGPAMDVLQRKATVTFKEYIVDAKPKHTSEPASYIPKITCSPDWNILYETETEYVSKQEFPPDYSLLDDFSAKQQCGLKQKLDETQMAAVDMALKQKVALIQGPPGTGKSHVGVSLVRLLLSTKVPQKFGPILVVTYKNHALDHFLVDCLKKIPSYELKLVRVGTPQHCDVEDYVLRKVAGRGKWAASNRHLNKAMKSQLFGMQGQIRDCYDNLRKINVFGIDTVVEEASDAQIKSLLTQGPGKKQLATSAEVEKLLKDRDSNPQLLTWRQREMVKKGLEKWLPHDENFQSFGGKESERPENSNSSPKERAKEPDKDEKGAVRKKKKEGSDEKDRINSFPLDRSTEENERRLAVGGSEEEEEEEEAGEQEASPDISLPQNKIEPWERYLPPVNDSETSKSKHLMNAQNVFELNDQEKISLVYVMQKQYREKIIKEFEVVSKLYAQKHQEFEDLKNQHYIDVLSQRHVIGMTVTGAALRANLLEEAAEILEPQLVAVIPPSVQHLIMIGDHEQLRPTVKFNLLARHCKLDVSMFERLIKAGMPQRSLGNQCRMRDELAVPIRELKIYDKYDTRAEMVRCLEPPDCVQNGLYFIDHTKEERTAQGSHSYCNPHEAREICRALKHLCGSGVPASKITVLCSYRGQVSEINRLLKDHDSVSDVEVTTIDSFQGKENDIIIVSLVRSNRQFTIGFLSSRNRLCVAISRARCALYLFGNRAALCQSSRKGWKKFIDYLQNQRRVGRTFPYCSSAGKGDKPSCTVGGRNSEDCFWQTDNKPSAVSSINIFNPSTVSIGDNTTVNVNGQLVTETGGERTCPPTPTEGPVQESDTLHSEVNDMTVGGERRPAEEHPLQPETLPHTVGEGNPNQEEARPGAADVDRADEQVTQGSDHTTPTVQESRVPKGDRENLTSQMIGPELKSPFQESEEGAMSDQKPVQDSEDVKKPPEIESTPHSESSLEAKEGFLSPDTLAPFQEAKNSSISKKNDQESRSVQEISKEGGFALVSTSSSGGESDSIPQELNAFESGPVSKSPLQESEEGAMSDQKPVQDSEDVEKPPVTETTPQAEKSLQAKEDSIPLDALTPLKETENVKISNKSDQESRSVQESSKKGGFADPLMSTLGSGSENDSVPQEPKAFESGPASKSPLQESEEGAMSEQKPVQDSGDVEKPPETRGFADTLMSTPDNEKISLKEPGKKSEAVEKNETTNMEECQQGAARVDEQSAGDLFSDVPDQNYPPEESGALEIPLD